MSSRPQAWLRDHWPALAVAGGGVVLLGLLSVMRTRTAVAYAATGSDTGTFGADAQRAAQALADAGMSPAVVAVYDAQRLAEALRGMKPLSRLVLVGHGSTSSFLNGAANLSPAQLAAMLAPVMSSGFVLGLAGCRAGADPGETNWGPDAYGPGGARSFAGQLRDALARLGVRGEVRAHSSTGGTTGNPSGRVFPIVASQVGRPGLSAIDAALGQVGAWQNGALRDRWIAMFRGGYGDRWMAGV